VRDDGTIAGFGMRYDYDNVFGHDNPTNQRKLRLFADWYDDRIAGDYRFVNLGGIVSGTYPVRPYQTIAALQVANGFSVSIDDSRVPNQGRYSLGGDHAIRGIGVEDELGRHIFLVRAELRQTIYPEVDFNLLNWVTMRRGQVRLFVDAGRVANDAGAIYDPSEFAVGVGVGMATVYDFFGFFPGVAFIEVAGRVDRFDGVDNGPQVLFGTRQSF
jgi:hemolysin activation/secretion protein